MLKNDNTDLLHTTNDIKRKIIEITESNDKLEQEI